MPLEQEKIFMIVRLFKMAQEKWEMTLEDCAETFKKWDIYNFIFDMYEEFHVQGDEANMLEIEEYIKNKGYML